jgi:hypothetical protein
VRPLFIDQNLDGDSFLDPLRKAGLTFVRHRDLFAQDVDDLVWIAKVARSGYIAVTGDKRTRWNDYERLQISAARARVLQLVRRNATHPELGHNLAVSYERVQVFFEDRDVPTIGVLSRPNAPSQNPGQAGTIREYKLRPIEELMRKVGL